MHHRPLAEYDLPPTIECTCEEADIANTGGGQFPECGCYASTEPEDLDDSDERYDAYRERFDDRGAD